MRELYINYALWKSIAQNNSFKVYEQATSANSAHVWCGTKDIIYRSDVDAATFADYDSAFPVGASRIAVSGADEATANIIGLATAIVNTIAPTFEDTQGIYPQWHGHLYDVTAGAVNIFDELITYEEQLRAGYYELLDNKAVIGDYIEESVVDKDDVLGYFSAYGYTVGVDVLELKKYVKKEYINPLTAGQRQIFQAGSTFVIYPGLYMRTVYTSVGAEDLKLKVTTLAYS